VNCKFSATDRMYELCIISVTLQFMVAAVAPLNWPMNERNSEPHKIRF